MGELARSQAVDAGEPVGTHPAVRLTLRLALALLPAAIILAIWVIALHSGNRIVGRFLASPEKTAATFWGLLKTGALLQHAGASVVRVFVGVGLATLVAVPLGILMGWSRTLDRVLSPTVEFLRPIPVAAWVPLSILLFGIGEKPARALIFLGAFFPIILNTVHGVKYVEKIHLRGAQMLGAKTWQVLARVVFPSALPSIITGIRLALGVGWWVVILAELLAVRSGIGYLMVEGQQLLKSDVIITGMFTIGLIGVALNSLAAWAERALLPWREH